MVDPYYFLFACLVGGDEQDDELHVIDDGKTRFLTGTPVSSLYHLKDLDNSDAAFFVFPDLGVRKEGRYKLKLTLFEIVESVESIFHPVKLNGYLVKRCITVPPCTPRRSRSSPPRSSQGCSVSLEPVDTSHAKSLRRNRPVEDVCRAGSEDSSPEGSSQCVQLV